MLPSSREDCFDRVSRTASGGWAPYTGLICPFSTVQHKNVLSSFCCHVCLCVAVITTCTHVVDTLSLSAFVMWPRGDITNVKLRMSHLWFVVKIWKEIGLQTVPPLRRLCSFCCPDILLLYWEEINTMHTCDLYFCSGAAEVHTSLLCQHVMVAKPMPRLDGTSSNARGQ